MRTVITRPVSGDGVYDKIVDEYRVMDDAPYTLESGKLRQMQRMERGLSYILINLKKPDLTLEGAAECSGLKPDYFERAFKAYYEMPFSRFVTKLRLRQAARDIQLGIFQGNTDCYGFSSTQSFSRAFTREFGISPREFTKGTFDVPSMPERKEVQGVKISKEYAQLNAMEVRGFAVDPLYGNDTYLMDACSYVYDDRIRRNIEQDARISPYYEKRPDIIGTWWYIPDAGLKYIFGSITERYDTVYNATARTTFYEDTVEPDSRLISVPKVGIVVQGGNYVLFSYDRPEKDSDIRLMSRIVWRYIFKEWIPLNQKKTNKLGCAYEIFTEDKVYVCVPVLSSFWNSDDLKPRDWSIANWARYIDDHITESLSLESLAFTYNYSPQNFRDIFAMYYGLTPSTYIRRRRMYLAENELAKTDDPRKRRNILRKYRFQSEKKLAQAREEEKEEVKMTDLVGFYEENMDRIKLRTVNLKDMTTAIHSVKQTEAKAFPDDLVERVLYWFHREFEDFSLIRKAIAKPEEKVFIWGDEPVMVDRRPVYQYYVGSVLRADADVEKITESGEYKGKFEFIPAGKYAEFTTADPTDEDSPKEAFQLLMRCAFGGWINMNRWRTDFSRRTFIMWKKSKLHFYVPLIK